MESGDLKAIAFHLPQFHPTRLNDILWGPGFTEWTNVVRAKPLFEGHDQPKLPGFLGFYDLRCAEALEDQAGLARQAGIDAFCFYYYRFGSQRVLERPLQVFLDHPEIDIGFMYCWANEDWTRAWDGRSNERLLTQTYGPEAFDPLVADLVRAMADERYVRIAGRPVFLIYQVEQVPEAQDFVSRLRKALSDALEENVMVGAVFSHGFQPSMIDFLDFIVQFPPHRIPRQPGSRAILGAGDVDAFDPDRGDVFEPYDSVMDAALDANRWMRRMFLGVTPDWDNSPRRSREAHILVGSTPEKFQEWTASAGRATLTRAAAGVIPAPVLFVNAWNEWAEGAFLEPSRRYGTTYLDAFSSGLDDARTLNFHREAEMSDCAATDTHSNSRKVAP
jgi:hypothetical protein